VLAVLLSRHAGARDVIVGSPIANRRDSRLERLIGFFANTLLMRIAVAPSMRIRAFLGHVRQVALDALRWQDVPFERLVEELAPQRTADVTPLFQVAFSHQITPAAAPSFRDLRVEPVAGTAFHARHPLGVHVSDSPQRIEVSWTWPRELFAPWRIEQLAAHYARIIDAIAADPDQVIGDVDLFTRAERETILSAWNETVRPY